jgi:hypothetical protein
VKQAEYVVLMKDIRPAALKQEVLDSQAQIRSDLINTSLGNTKKHKRALEHNKLVRKWEQALQIEQQVRFTA